MARGGGEERVAPLTCFRMATFSSSIVRLSVSIASLSFSPVRTPSTCSLRPPIAFLISSCSATRSAAAFAFLAFCSSTLRF